MKLSTLHVRQPTPNKIERQSCCHTIVWQQALCKELTPTNANLYRSAFIERPSSEARPWSKLGQATEIGITGRNREMPGGKSPEEQERLEVFARRFQRFRKMLGLSQSKLARKLDLPEYSIYRYERAKGYPSFAALRKVYDLAEHEGIWPELFLDHDRVFFLQAARESIQEDAPNPWFAKLRIDGIATAVPGVLEVLNRHDAQPIRMEASQQVGPDSQDAHLRLAFELKDPASKETLDRDLLNAHGVQDVGYPKL